MDEWGSDSRLEEPQKCHDPGQKGCFKKKKKEKKKMIKTCSTS
ncbi:hypothetical protein AtNW77_Chr5g0134201 [Arabidopsis thaliana]